jgi:hypothetical protein
MATFIVKGLEYRLGKPVTDGPPPDAFTDDNGNIHEANINKAAALGIAAGTGGTNYSPRTQYVEIKWRPLTREHYRISSTGA